MRHTITLHALDGSRIGMTAVTVNQHGELPVLIVDPKDPDGRVIPGMWLAQMFGRVLDRVSYHQINSQMQVER